ncbi:MAG TPA: DUF4852 domain-containing protein [Alphaproteobacteria bacterium]|nr:DUF4852 domain-containing protein [Alphaproteobacteria bacterium]
MRIFAFIAILVSFSLSPEFVRAQDTLDEGDFVAAPDITFDSTSEDETDDEFGKDFAEDEEVTVMEDKYAGQYVEPTLQNISKLYWKKGALVESNDTAIDNYMLINECDIYEKFYKDDFEWQRIREAGREMLKENKANFSQKFKMVVPIDLGRYDMMRKGFPLINKTAFKDLRRVEIGGNSNRQRVCGVDNIIENYPRNLILILNKPFSYEFVQLDEHVAQAFIIRRKYEKIVRPKELENKTYDRLAFARIRITFADYQGETRGSDNFPLAVMFGRLDGIDIFEDAGEKRLLTSVDYK